MKKILCSIILIFVAINAANAASIINISTSNTNPTFGQTFEIDFKISNLLQTTDDSLSGFDINFLFDNNVLSLAGFSFVDPSLGNNQLEFAEIGSLPFYGDVIDLGSGVIDAFGISGNSAGVLDANQENQFQFLSLSFLVLSSSTSTNIGIDMSDPGLLFLNSSFNDLPVDLQSSTTNISISTSENSNSVPEPNTILLLTTASLMFVRRLKPMKCS